MGDCFVCKEPLIQDIYVAKKRAVKTLLAASAKRRCEEHQRMLENVVSVSVHSACYKKYSNLRLASRASRQSKIASAEPEKSEQPQVIPVFDFKNNCLLCGEEIKDEYKLPIHRRKKIHSVKYKSMQENLVQRLAGRDDDFSLSIFERIKHVPDLVATGARYHRKCFSRVYHPPPTEEVKKGRPFGDKVDEAMEEIYSFLRENSDESPFFMSELIKQIKGDFVPEIRTIKTQLKKKYGQDILFNEKQGRGCLISFRTTEILLETWYKEKEQDTPPELLELGSCKCKGNCGAACGCRRTGFACSINCLNCNGETCNNILLDEDDEKASPELLEVISCKCKGQCETACGCRKAGFACSINCLNCTGETCNNIAKVNIMVNEEDENDWNIEELLHVGEESSQFDEYYEHEYWEPGPSNQ